MSARTISGQVTQLLEQKAQLEGGREGGEAAVRVYLEPQEEARRVLLLATRDQVEAVRKLVATFDLPGQAVVTRLYTPPARAG